MNTTKRYTQEVRERAVRMVLDHERDYDSQWAAIKSIAEKIGCTSETLRKWLRQAERDSGKRPRLNKFRMPPRTERAVTRLSGSGVGPSLRP